MNRCIETVTPVAPCPVCGSSLNVFAQPSWKPDAPPILQADCRNPACGLYQVTLSPGEHDRLTTAQIEGYARARASVDVRRQASVRSSLERISPRQLSILVFLATARQVGAQPTLQELADRHGIHINQANLDMRRLRALGLVKARNGRYRDYQIAEDV